MKKFIFLFSMIAVMSACGNVANSDKEVNTDSVTVVNDSVEADSMMNDTIVVDSMVCDSIQ